MKRFLFSIILLSSFYTLNSFAQTRLSGGQGYGWFIVDPISISGTPDFADAFFIDDNIGWITSPIIYNEIYKTTDGASSFSTQTTPLGATTAIHMLDTDNGYSGGEGGWVYKTDDSGLNWNIVNSMGTLLDISFPFGTTPVNPIGYACGDNGQVWEITSTLTNLNSGLSSSFSGISAPSVNNVWVCGGTHVFFYNGSTFYDQTIQAGTVHDIHFINDLEGWVVGDGGIISHTTDGGTSWVSQTNPDTLNRPLYSVFFLDSDNGWAVGNGGVILHTTNGGTTWVIEGEGLTTAFLRGIHFTSATNGYVVGNEKTLIKFGEITSVDDGNISPGAFSLSQNYPNPFNPNTKIKFRIPQTGFTSLKVYDVLGNEVVTLVNGEKPAGEYEIDFNTNGFTSGIYFYQLRAENFIDTKKMILMK